MSGFSLDFLWKFRLCFPVLDWLPCFIHHFVSSIAIIILWHSFSGSSSRPFSSGVITMEFVLFGGYMWFCFLCWCFPALRFVNLELVCWLFLLFMFVAIAQTPFFYKLDVCYALEWLGCWFLVCLVLRATATIPGLHLPATVWCFQSLGQGTWNNFFLAIWTESVSQGQCK